MTKHKTFANGLTAAAALIAGLSMADSAVAAEELQMSYFVGQLHTMVKDVVVPLQEKISKLIGG